MRSNDWRSSHGFRSAALAWLGVAIAPVIAGAQGNDSGCEARPSEEGYFTSINGVDQWITIRGENRCNPALIILHGGPGMASSNSAPLYASWEKDYTVVQWDQPMSGATYAKNLGKDIGPLTIERYVADAGEVIDHVRARLDKDQVIIMGASWGSILGIYLAHERPFRSASGGSSMAIWEPSKLRAGIPELKIDFGPGYRVCYTERNGEVIILLAGGDKSTQQQDIEVAVGLARGL